MKFFASIGRRRNNQGLTGLACILKIPSASATTVVFVPFTVIVANETGSPLGIRDLAGCHFILRENRYRNEHH